MHTNFMEENILIDFHAHILPGMDDGCDDIAISLGQLKLAADHNITMVVATSHFYPHMENVEDFLRRREEAWKALTAFRINEKPIIKLGAEVLLSNNIDKMKGIEELCVESSNVLLIEMPYMKKWESSLIETVVRLRERNRLEVVLAHGERYPVKEIEKLLIRGFSVQLNVASTAPLFSSPFIRKCMEKSLVAAFGSDLHGHKNNYKDFTRSMKKWGRHALRVMDKTYQLIGCEDKETLIANYK